MTSPEQEIAQWTWAGAVAQAKELLESRGIKRVSQPVADYGSIGQIEDIETLGDMALGNLHMKTMSWYAYATTELAFARAEFASFEEIFDLKVGKRMHDVSKEQDKREVQAILKSLAILGSEELTVLQRKRIELQVTAQLLEGMVRGLEIQAKALESESIRRASARRTEIGR